MCQPFQSTPAKGGDWLKYSMTTDKMQELTTEELAAMIPEALPEYTITDEPQMPKIPEPQRTGNTRTDGPAPTVPVYSEGTQGDARDLWGGYVAADWAAGAETLHLMSRWAYGLGLRYEGDPAKVQQWTGVDPAHNKLLGGLYAKYAGCRRWWTSWQQQDADKRPMVLLDTISCHDPMCPLCMRLKAHKREMAYSAAWADIQQRKISRDGTGYRLLQVVVDAGRNCTGDELRDSLSRLISGTQRLIRWLDQTKGVIAHAPAAWIWGAETQHSDAPLWMLGTEVTRHHAAGPLHGSYHPHCHIMLAVYSRDITTVRRTAKDGSLRTATSWRKSAGITRAEMLDKWRDIMGDSTITNLYMGEAESPHQALKYAVKGAVAKSYADKDAGLYVGGDDYDSYNMDTLQAVHDAIVEYRPDSRNRSRQMFRASAAWAHLAAAKAAELAIQLDSTDTEGDTVAETSAPGQLVHGRTDKGELAATYIDPGTLTLAEAKEQVRLAQQLRHKRGV